MTTLTQTRSVADLTRDLDAGGIQTREYSTTIHRAEDTTDPKAGRRFSGQAVPFDEEITLWPGIREKIARGAVQGTDGQLWYRHREPIGLFEGRDGESHWDIDAEVSDTTLGRDTLVLLADGVIKKLSIGFRPIEWTITEHRDGEDDYTLITYTQIWVNEVSTVPNPAYENTSISNLRHRATHPEGNPMSDTPTQPATGAETAYASAADVTELTRSVEEIDRRVGLLTPAAGSGQVPTRSQYRSVGEILKAIVAGDAEARTEYNQVMQRAYVGTVLADDVEAPEWARDLTRLVDAASGIATFFSSAPLPAEGMTVDGVKVESNTVTVDKQVNEGDTLAFGKVTLAPESWPVETFGGYTSLSQRVIDRSRTNIVDLHMRAMAIAAGKGKAQRFRDFYAGVVTAQEATANKVTIPAAATWQDWLNGLVDAIDLFTDTGLSLDALIVPKATLKTLIGYVGADGRPMMDFDSSGANTVGSVDLTATRIGAKLASLQIIYNAKGTARPAFVNKEAIRSFESPLARLQDGDIINLTQDFSVYQYAALADEIPEGIVPVVPAA